MTGGVSGKPTRGRLARAVLPLLWASTLAAQDRPPQPGQSTFRATTDAYQAAVIVREKNGQFVPTLKPSDFEIREDGVLQKLVFHLLSFGGRQTSSSLDKALAHTEGVVLPTKAPPVMTSGRVFVIFIDDLHILASDSVKARHVVKEIQAILHDGDQIAIVSTGPSSIAINPTLDVTRVDEAIEHLMGDALDTTAIVTGAQTAEGPAQLRHNTHVAFNTAYEILKQLEDVRDKRKSFLYVSEGYDFNPDKEARFEFYRQQFQQTANNTTDGTNATSAPTQNPFESGSHALADANLIREIDELCRAAKRANVAFYTIDPRGLIAGGDIADNLSIRDVLDHVREQTSSLMVLAEQTGGRALVNSNGTKEFLKQVDNETSDYYMVGWVSTNPDPLKRYRKIEITIKDHPDYELIYPHDYTIKAMSKR